MPSLGADMEAGTLVEWRKHPGDPVRRGEVVAVVETQKGAIEVEIFEDGVVERLLVEPGVSVPVGTPLAILADAGAAFAEAAAPQPIQPVSMAARILASPAARSLACRHGIELAGLHGTGPGGAVVSLDVERRIAEQPRSKPAKGLDLAEMRRAIASAMSRSKREIPHYYLGTTVDITNTLAWLEEVNAARPPPQRLLLAALLVKAVALALREASEFNGFYTADGFQASRSIHIGFAVAIRGGGLVAPAILDTDRLDLDTLMARLRDLVARARIGALRSSELSEPTVTVTSIGDRGVETIFGVIYPPQVALVGFGKPAERPWVVNGTVVPRRLLTVTLSADHRASDGHRGGLFLSRIEQLLQEAGKL